MIFRTFSALFSNYLLTRGDALRSAHRLPLAFIFRAFGAWSVELKPLNHRRGAFEGAGETLGFQFDTGGVVGFDCFGEGGQDQGFVGGSGGVDQMLEPWST